MAKVYSTPFETSPFRVDINMPNKVSSADYANDVFVIIGDETRTRQVTAG